MFRYQYAAEECSRSFHFNSMSTEMLSLEHTYMSEDKYCSTVTKYFGIVLQINYITRYQHDHYTSLQDRVSAEHFTFRFTC